MNILVISPGIYPCVTGGVEIFNHYLIKELAKRGHKVWVLTTCAYDWNDRNISLIKLNERFLINPTLSTEFHLSLELMKLKKQIDVIYVPYTSNSLLAYPMLFVKEFLDIHYVVTIHGGGMYPWKRKALHKLFFKHADAIVAVSETIKKEYERRSGRKIKVIPPVIPFNESKVSKDELRKRYGFDNDDRIILSVGSIKKIKGSDVLLRAFLDLGKKYIERSNLKLLYVGDGLMKPMLLEDIKKRSFDEYVNFLGIIPYEEVPHIYKLADIYVISSLLEGTPIALLEAMFDGLPIVGTDVNGINNLIRHEKNGLLFEKKNVKDLTEKIKELVENKDLCNRLGDAAKIDYLKNYRFEYVISQYIELFAEVCKEEND
jgi:glycosyltransferase involved in cell wall biosynthesis